MSQIEALHSFIDHRRLNMRVEPQVPTAHDAVRHFRDMANGRLPKDTGRSKKKLFGGWGGGGATYMKTTLVTPTAMALEQAKSELREKGELPPKRKRSSTTTKKRKASEPKKKKPKAKPAIKGRQQQKRLQSAIGRRQVKTHSSQSWRSSSN